MTNESNDNDEGYYVELDECYQDGRRIRRRRRRVELTASTVPVHIADLLALMDLARHARPRGAMTAKDLISRIGETLLRAALGSMTLVSYRVPEQGSAGLGSGVSSPDANRNDADDA